MKEIISLDDLEIGSEIRYINLYGYEVKAIKISHSVLIESSNIVVSSLLYKRDNNKLYFGDDYNNDHMVDTIYDPKGNCIYNHKKVKQPERSNDWLDKYPF